MIHKLFDIALENRSLLIAAVLVLSSWAAIFFPATTNRGVGRTWPLRCEDRRAGLGRLFPGSYEESKPLRKRLNAWAARPADQKCAHRS